MSSDQTTPSDAPAVGEPEYSVREEGCVVILEMRCRDHYEAMELCEVIASGIRHGGLTLTLGKGGADGE